MSDFPGKGMCVSSYINNEGCVLLVLHPEGEQPTLPQESDERSQDNDVTVIKDDNGVVWLYTPNSETPKLLSVNPLSHN